MTRSIYVIRSEPGPVKVGIATKVASRVSQLRVSSPVPLHLAYSAEAGSSVVTLEKRTHEILSSKQLSGEWFEVAAEEAISAVELAANELGIDLLPINVSHKSVGRPATGKTPRVGVRLNNEIRSQIEAYRQKHKIKTTSEAIRRLVEKALGDE